MADMSRLLAACLGVAGEWLPVPQVSVRHRDRQVEVEVSTERGRDAASSFTIAPTTFTARCERGEAGNPRRPYQAFWRAVSLPWEVIPGTTHLTGSNGRFRLSVDRAGKAHVGERVILETPRAAGDRKGDRRHKVAT